MKYLILGGLLFLSYSVVTHNIIGFTGWLAFVLYATLHMIKDEK